MGIKYVGVEEGREFRFRGDLYSQESTFPLVLKVLLVNLLAAVNFANVFLNKKTFGKYKNVVVIFSY